MTEASPGVLFLRARDSLRKVGSAGTPCFFADVDVVDDAGHSVPAGAPGEIAVQGPNVIRGYWRDDEATEAVLTDGGWFRSGDIAVRDGEGHLRIVDRKKDMFISGGENVYPVFVVLRAGCELDQAEVERFLADRLARYKIPRSLVRVDALPRIASGKLLRKQLRAWPG